MSQRNADIMFIVEYVRRHREYCVGSGTPRSIAKLRLEASKELADFREVDSSTVQDKYIRQLKPDVVGTGGFDQVLEDYFLRGSDQLKNILLRRTSDLGDREDINLSFDTPLAPDAALAHQFGFEPTDKEFLEGNERYELHCRKERNSSLVEYAKEKWNREQEGQVSCSVCSFCFADRYGQLGKDCIEAHHTVPISSLTQETRVKLADLVPVCSNCHAVLHRARPPLTVDELRSRLLK